MNNILDIFIKKHIKTLKNINKNQNIETLYLKNEYTNDSLNPLRKLIFSFRDLIYIIIFILLITSFLSCKYRQKNNIKKSKLLYNMYLLLTIIIVLLLFIFIYY
jgi:hypothetical protein